MARRPFRTSDALVVVSSDGYFDVYSTAGRRPNDKPVYRGVIAELGPTVRGQDGRLSVRPDSVALDAAVTVWSGEHGAAAVRGDLGKGRYDSGVAPKAEPKAEAGAEPKAESKAESKAAPKAKAKAEPEAEAATAPAS